MRVRAHEARFSYTTAFSSYVYGPSGVTGLDAEGNATFNGDFAFPQYRDSTIALLGVICQVGSAADAASFGVLCYLTQ